MYHIENDVIHLTGISFVVPKVYNIVFDVIHFPCQTSVGPRMYNIENDVVQFTGMLYNFRFYTICLEKLFFEKVFPF